MRSTKDKILTASRLLFNEKSFSSVTIRMIAASLKMSSGNLNYHFKKREEILESLYFEMANEFDQRLLGFSEIEFSINQLKTEIKLTMTRMIDYQFFWTDLYNIINANENIKTHFHEVYATRYKNYMFLFEQLQNNKIIKASILKWEFENLSEQMIIYNNTWLYSTVLYGGNVTKNIIEEKANTMVRILYPYLTEKGREEFYEVVNSSQNKSKEL
ncbi:TetR/AcrR family transcriptional regulator [uncultured Tenacibaculum sp.]|uniref:TetR/AcrR family transcriptional regulator n=1 Tax=uncultured Tenacibaculum sp. TaxID=174713 RepID=UPI002605F3F8|nr:TetR/AcrR family transcriptional regulator [uncultured Tenacibaculum sp.]